MHNANPIVLHRDIKPENILVGRDLNIKLCDFGLGRLSETPEGLQSTVGNNFKGTVVYMAPEILIDNRPATIKSDTWSGALVVIELFIETRA